MSDEHVLLPLHQNGRVEVELDAPAVVLPPPSPERQQLADTVFSREQGGVAVALMGLQAGLAIMHHLAVETFETVDDDEDDLKRRKMHPEDKA